MLHIRVGVNLAGDEKCDLPWFSNVWNLYTYTAQKESKYGVLSGSYFAVLGLNKEIFSPNTGQYRPGKTPYLDSFYAVL